MAPRRTASLRLVLIAPLACRNRHARRLLYREPACLLCTDPNLPPQQIVRACFQRWDIEVNFRDQKSLLGVGRARVRHPRSVQAVPAFQVAASALQLPAALQVDPALLLPPPSGTAAANPNAPPLTHCSNAPASKSAAAASASAISPASPLLPSQTPENLSLPLPSALLYAYA